MAGTAQSRIESLQSALENKDPVMLVDELAAILGIGKDTMYYALADGTASQNLVDLAIRSGRRIVFPRARVIQLLMGKYALSEREEEGNASKAA